MLCCLNKENYYLNNTTKQTQKIKTLKFVCKNVECEIRDIICVVKEKKNFTSFLLFVPCLYPRVTITLNFYILI